MEAVVKKQLIKSIETIKKKAKQMREEEDDLELKRRKLFKSITDPLESIVLQKKENKNNSHHDLPDTCSPSTSDKIKNIENDDKNYVTPKPITSTQNFEEIEEFYTPSPTPEKSNEIYNLNVPFGVRNENSNLMIGNTKVTFSDGDAHSKNMMAKIGNRSYEVTPGLAELLFQSKPDVKIVSDQDKLVYKDILCNTSAHRRDYNPTNQIKGDKGTKYTKIVKPLFTDSELKEKKQGGFMPTLKTLKKNTDFIYWDDPNELVDRLKILIASKDAGNTSHDNEIISIIEELKEAGIIK